MEFTDDREMQMQSMCLRADLQVRDRAEVVQVRPIVQVRYELRLRELIAARRIAFFLRCSSFLGMDAAPDASPRYAPPERIAVSKCIHARPL